MVLPSHMSVYFVPPFVSRRNYKLHICNMVIVRPSSYGCTQEVAKHQRSGSVVQGDGRVQI